MTERIIQCGLWAMAGLRSEVIMPNFTPPDWFEADLWACTKAGYAVEYEIKLSRADFKADAGKEGAFYDKGLDGKRLRADDGFLLPPRKLTKHSMLAASDPRGPSRFFYVTPPGVLGETDLPPWAGHILFNPDVPIYRSTKVIVDAPKLHRQKVEHSVKVQAWRAGYYRFWRIRERSALKAAGKSS